jgi:NTP pyrophosphatase (non-canonical NTP hydrolase)
MSEIKELMIKINKFVQERDWNQFQKPKDLAISLALESAEVLEHFQWKNGDELTVYLAENKNDLGEELADVFVYLLELSQSVGVDLIEATHQKIAKNALKYPVDKAKGNYKKYNEF